MLVTKAPRGTNDLLPRESDKWHYIEDKARDICRRFSFGEIRTPMFEHTELFLRGVGDTTDVVEKQMYTFDDKGGRSITLRPEGTAGAARAYIEHSLYADTLPAKMYYIIPCFRYEKPQAGRLRQFHQFGVEVFGSAEANVDAEIISLAMSYLEELGLNNLKLAINSIGCPECRKQYNKALEAYFEKHIDALCETCRSRLKRNPLRILDCKSPVCAQIAADAPKLLGHICETCDAHFEQVKSHLSGLGISYTVDPNIVRGLDYYTKTVFEIISNASTLCGGGRYDGLIEELGGPSACGIGFGLGLERLIMAMEQQNVSFGDAPQARLFIANIGEKAAMLADSLVYGLRRAGISCEKDRMNRSLKAQMKYADKMGFAYSVVLGDDEVATNRARLKNMENGETVEIALDELSQALK